MKVHSLLGWKEVPYEGVTFVTDENDDVDVPDDLGRSLLEQEEAWGPASGGRRTTIKQILAEVGDDPALAAAALEVENASDEPRPTLIEALSAVVANGGEV